MSYDASARASSTGPAKAPAASARMRAWSGPGKVPEQPSTVSRTSGSRGGGAAHRRGSLRCGSPCSAARAPSRVRAGPASSPRRPAPSPARSSWRGRTRRTTSANRRLVVMSRPDGRTPDQLRTVVITRGWQEYAEGSTLVDFGRTRVLCAASVQESVPRWRRGSGLGWVTAEYAMLPRATATRTDRESVRGRIGGRTHEISRLVGRGLRACVDLAGLGENTIAIDCDVLQADGGTRTAAITGAYVALADAVSWLGERGSLHGQPLVGSVSAVSVGVVAGEPRLDLCYDEDVTADTDMNVVVTGTGDFVEVQGTAERRAFDRRALDLSLIHISEPTRP